METGDELHQQQQEQREQLEQQQQLNNVEEKQERLEILKLQQKKQQECQRVGGRILAGLPEYNLEEVKEERKKMKERVVILSGEEFRDAVHKSECVQPFLNN